MPSVFAADGIDAMSYGVAMTTLVITLLGDDKPGIVALVSEAVAQHGASWERSSMARIAGKFAGIVEVSASEVTADALIDDLSTISAGAALELTIERVLPSTEPRRGGYRASLTLTGQDHPGLLHDVAAVFASLGVSIEELETDTGPAPMGGFVLFGATATLFVPDQIAPGELESALEDIANDLMVEIEFE